MDDELENDVESDDEEKTSNSEIRINLISSHKLDSMSSAEKLRFILDEVKKGNVLVLERGLTAEEEIDLIKKTMSEIDHESFIGIETPTFPVDFKKKSFIDRIFKRAQSPRMMVVGPAHLLKTIKKDGMMIQTRVLTGRSIVAKVSKDEREADDEEEVETSEVSSDSYEDEVKVNDLEVAGDTEVTSIGESAQPPINAMDALNDSDEMYHTPAEDELPGPAGEQTLTDSDLGSEPTHAPLAEPVEKNELEHEPQDTTIDELQPVLDPFQIQPVEIPDAPSIDTDVKSETHSDDRDGETAESSLDKEDIESNSQTNEESDNISSFLYRRLKNEDENEEE